MAEQEPVGKPPLDEVVKVLVRSLRALGQAGRPTEASRLAARAWWLLQEPAPVAAEHINGVMHYLARLPEEDPQSLPNGAANPSTSLKETQHVAGS